VPVTHAFAFVIIDAGLHDNSKAKPPATLGRVEKAMLQYLEKSSSKFVKSNSYVHIGTSRLFNISD
jgi:hypothetical protein